MSTDDELLDLSGIGQRSSDILFEVLDSQLVKIGEVKPDLDTPASVQNNTNRTLKRTLSNVRLNPSEQADLDPFGHRLRPVWVLENGSRFDCGVFVLGSIDRVRHDYGLDADVTAVDQCVILDQPLETTVACSTGASVHDAIVAQLEAANVPSYDVDSTITSVIANPIAWPAGNATRMSVVNDLAAFGGAYSVYFDRSGVARVVRVPDLSTVTPTLIYEAGGRIIVDSMVESDSLLDAPNRYIVIDSSNPDQAIVGYFDVPSSAPYSELGRGFVVVAPVINEQGLPDITAAQGRAAAAYAQDAGTYQWVQFSSSPDPRHDTYDAVQYLGNIYREQAWELELRDGSDMKHDLRRVYSDG